MILKQTIHLKKINKKNKNKSGFKKEKTNNKRIKILFKFNDR